MRGIKWTLDEDELLMDLLEELGPTKYHIIAQRIGRTKMACQKRAQYIRNRNKRGLPQYSADPSAVLLQRLQRFHGEKTPCQTG